MLREEMKDKMTWMVPVVVLMLVLISFGTYQWVIPRTNLEVRTVYHEAPGGGGTGGTININVLLSNLGNREVTSLDCSVLVSIKGGGRVSDHEMGPETLSASDNIEIKITYIGSQYDTYLIDIDLRFDCSGDTHTSVLNYETREDMMNLAFVENLG